MSEWIKCSERLPEEKVVVLTWDGYDICTAYRVRDYWNDTIGWPTHWMPLPAPPAEDE